MIVKHTAIGDPDSTAPFTTAVEPVAEKHLTEFARPPYDLAP